jgi:intracellular septation protein A
VDAFELLLIGVIAIYLFQRITRWMHRRGWIQWKPRGTSAALGNAVIGVQTFFQPQMREVLESRLEEHDEREASGEPPDPGLTNRRSA